MPRGSLLPAPASCRRAVIRGLALAGVMLLAGPAAMAASSPDVTGLWWTAGRDAQVALYRAPDGSVSGRIQALLPEDAGQLDKRNPDPARRNRPVLGVEFLHGFKLAPDRQSFDGTVYDPENGGSYNAELWLDGPDHLMMRGYIGISLFGRTERFDRVGAPAPSDPVMVRAPGS